MSWEQASLFAPVTCAESRTDSREKDTTRPVCWVCRSRLGDDDIRRFQDDGMKYCGRCRKEKVG